MFNLLLVENKLILLRLNTKKASHNFNDIYAEDYAVLCDQDVQLLFCIISHFFCTISVSAVTTDCCCLPLNHLFVNERQCLQRHFSSHFN